MRKKIGELTLREFQKMCDEHGYGRCIECQFFNKDTDCCLLEPPLLNEDLNKEVEVDDYRIEVEK